MKAAHCGAAPFVLCHGAGISIDQDNQRMDKHTPEHPLPEEILKMPRDKTICTYCGVSYLILHEFKLLEDKIKTLENELTSYRGSAEREKKLQDDLLLLSQELEQSKTDGESKAERLKILTSQINEKENELHLLTEELACSKEEVTLTREQEQLFRDKSAEQQEKLTKTLSLLKFLQCEQVIVKSDLNAMLTSWITLKSQLGSQVQDIGKTLSAEVIRLNKNLAEAQGETLSLQNQMKHLQTVSDSFVLTSQELQTSRQMENELKNRCHDLQKLTVDIQQQLQKAELDFQKAITETEHYKEISIVKTKEVDDFQSRIRRMEYEKESMELRLAKELRGKEDSEVKSRSLQDEIAERERREELEIKRTRRLENELEAVKKMLIQTQQEVVTLQNDRELKIVSYQNRIEQLQETLRQRMLSDDNWQTKLEIELEKERQKCMLKLQDVEQKLKEEANMEMDIQRQKQDELIREFQTQRKELEGKIPSLITKACGELNKDVDLLERKLKETQARLTDKDHGKENENKNLKNTITELELCLEREQNNNRSVLEGIRKDNLAKSEDLKEATRYIEGLRRHLDFANQELSLKRGIPRCIHFDATFLKCSCQLTGPPGEKLSIPAQVTACMETASPKYSKQICQALKEN
uniref:Leucine, glutamate and lysine rich 1 n=1 Tax=Leptobrachium leishanense TaxID=445787 RepID=A0A8C5MYW7_9ANUR